MPATPIYIAWHCTVTANMLGNHRSNVPYNVTARSDSLRQKFHGVDNNRQKAADLASSFLWRLLEGAAGMGAPVAITAAMLLDWA